MLSYRYLLDIALILLTTKAFGMVTRRFKMPQVVGALIAGLVFGPAMLNILHGTEFLSQLSELGVIVIMFSAGLETDLRELKATGKAGFLVALLGVIAPLLMGMGVGYLFNRGTAAGATHTLLQNLFIGVVLTATSVSITVEALKEMGKLSTAVGNTILAAALIDDVLGLVCLTLISSLGGEAGANVGLVLLKILLFFAFAVVVGLLVWKGLCWYCKRVKDANLRRFPVLAFVFCLLMAYLSEHLFGVADIIGAFAAGLVIGNTSQATYIDSRLRPISYLLLTPIFFAGIGINIQIEEINLTLLVITLVLVLVAVLSKLVGCGVGARVCGMSFRQSVQVGLGMACRGEVALIVANKGMAMGLMPPMFMGPIIIMVVLTAVVTPVLLKLAFAKDAAYSSLAESPLVDRYEAVEQLDVINQRLIQAEQALQTARPKDTSPR